MSDLIRAWKLRTALAGALDLALDEVNEQLSVSSTAVLIEFIDSFSPARAPGPEWVVTFDRLVEQIWEVVDGERIAALEAEYRARGPIWAAVANSFVPQRGEKLRAERRRPHGARRAAVVLR
jgi:hypothetical protein